MADVELLILRALFAVEDKLDAVLLHLTHIERKQDTQMADLTGLTAEVTNNTSVTASALVLIQGFAAALAAAGTDPAALQALQDTLAANDTALSEAVAANTPAAP